MQLDSDKKSALKNLLVEDAIELVDNAQRQKLLSAGVLAADPKFQSLAKYAGFQELVGD